MHEYVPQPGQRKWLKLIRGAPLSSAAGVRENCDLMFLVYQSEKNFKKLPTEVHCCFNMRDSGTEARILSAEQSFRL